MHSCIMICISSIFSISILCLVICILLDSMKVCSVFISKYEMQLSTFFSLFIPILYVINPQSTKFCKNSASILCWNEDTRGGYKARFDEDNLEA